jgi:hypothetical protein
VVKWLELLLIRKVKVSNLGPDSGYSDTQFSLFSSASCLDITLQYAAIVSFHVSFH